MRPIWDAVLVAASAILTDHAINRPHQSCGPVQRRECPCRLLWVERLARQRLRCRHVQHGRSPAREPRITAKGRKSVGPAVYKDAADPRRDHPLHSCDLTQRRPPRPLSAISVWRLQQIQPRALRIVALGASDTTAATSAMPNIKPPCVGFPAATNERRQDTGWPQRSPASSRH
jgi:hypothetical protein